MPLKHPVIQNTLGLALATTAGLLRRTLDCRAVYFDPATDPVHPCHQGRFVYLGWHEYALMPAVLRGSQRTLVLSSSHRDGQIAARAMRHLGWTVIHGSSTRGGAGALLRLMRDDRRHICLTPDGPKGPRRAMALGAMFLASRLGLPVVCVGYGYDRPWRLKSWDKFAVPRPFSRGRAVFGPPTRVPPDLDRSGLEAHRDWFEKLLNWLTGEAEEWAATGRNRPGESVLRPGYTPDAMHRARPRAVPQLPPALAAERDRLGSSGALEAA
jgi:lysophospholipid acyltransferase (LPLAT)-like uncharacterized protein